MAVIGTGAEEPEGASEQGQTEELGLGLLSPIGGDNVEFLR